MIAPKRARQSSSNRQDSLKIKNSVNIASDSVRKKKRDSEATRALSVLIARSGRRICVKMLTMIKRSYECVLRTLTV